MKKEAPAIGIIGGSGLYQMEEPRDASIVGAMGLREADRRVSL
jgi:purine nucleoside phosphorylase